MSTIATHLVRRGLEATRDRYQTAGNDVTTFQIPAWGIAILWISGFAYLLFLGAIDYTYGSLVATLATIENTTTTAYIKTEAASDSDDPDAPLIPNDEKAALKVSELLVVKSQPITAKLRTTIQHLRARAGFFSRFRGIQVVFVYGFLHTLLTDALVGLLPAADATVPYLCAVLSAMLLARLPLTWTHVVISEPSDKRWFRRILGFKSWSEWKGLFRDGGCQQLAASSKHNGGGEMGRRIEGRLGS